jgi:hypothetical protein
MRDPTARVLPGQLVGLPVAVESFSHDADGKIDRRPDWAEAASTNLDTSLNYRLSVHGSRFFTAGALDAVEGYDALRTWTLQNLRRVLAQARERSGYEGHPNVASYQVTEDLEPLRSALRADFAVLSYFLDGEDSAGRAAMTVAGVFAGAGYSVARREAIACVLDLRNRQLVWCQFRHLHGPVRTREGAQPNVDALVEPMFTVLPQGRGEAAPTAPLVVEAPAGGKP